MHKMQSRPLPACDRRMDLRAPSELWNTVGGVVSVTVPTRIIHQSRIGWVDEIARAYTLLSAIKQNVPSKFEIGKSWVIDFHSVLDRVEKCTGMNMQRFRIPEADLYKETLGGNSTTGVTCPPETSPLEM